MTRSRPGPDPDQLLVARISGIAQRYARWGGLTEAGKRRSSGAAGGRRRADLLAEVAGLALGAAEDKGAEYAARGEAVAELCRLAGADEDAIPRWIEEGRRRAASAALPPFSGGLRQHP